MKWTYRPGRKINGEKENKLRVLDAGLRFSITRESGKDEKE